MDDNERLQFLIEKGNDVLKTYKPNPPNTFGFETLDSGQFIGWKTQALTFIQSILPSDSPYIEIFKSNVKKGFNTDVNEGIGILESVKEDLKLGLYKIKDEPTFQPATPLINIFEKFHIISRQLRNRYNTRPTLDVQDEYDLQNLLHSLLHLYFEDIRPEEWTPSYAGKSSRMDFLLKDFKLVIEVKKTRKGLTEKELGSQLIDDIGRYRSHPDCKTLICFTYDPEGLIGNPRGLENDLNRVDESGLIVKVIIRP
ncbi:PD-(D/E)XK nuclease domain-containing protein [Halpernia frigidisoli]|uniref:Malate dehydrogenase n=1 Tax=Halpernia frigidisoli TaxID=1125876 RepID=A0A1I3FJ22_9FLAO|nr:hypothetical protein [Halpernia frigidisoli]SFI11223.1 hypothetical protein SAMN05443292_1414 [Halpernia frigidisoli]